jgi:hypothetical protein
MENTAVARWLEETVELLEAKGPILPGCRLTGKPPPRSAT